MITLAESFVDWFITTYEKSDFLKYVIAENKTDLINEKNEWLKYLDVNCSYENTTGVIMQNFEFTRYPNYDFLIDTPYASYRIKMNYGDQYAFSSVELRQVLIMNIHAT